jgi:hypothetical protein
MFAEDLYGQYPLGLDAIDQVCPGILVDSIKRRLRIWSVAYTWVYRRRRTMNDWLQRGFYYFNGVLF